MLAFFILDSINLSYQFTKIFPSFFILSFIYWNLAIPEKIGIGFPLLVGVFYDFVQGTLIGIFPLIFVFISFLCQRFFYQFRPLKFIQQSIVIFLLFLVIHFLLGIDFENSVPSSITFVDNKYVLLSFSNALVNAITWPFLFFILRYYRRKLISN